MIASRLQRTGALSMSLIAVGLPAMAQTEPASSREPPPAESAASVSDAEVSDLAEMSLEELLDTRVTTASLTDQSLSDAPGVMTVVTRDEIRRFGGNTLMDILERVPSLTASTAYFADRSTIAPRGDQIRVDSGHVLILINGRPTREGLAGGVSSEVLEAFPVSVIERIEVIRGPGSVLYGSNAFSAVINVITQEPTEGTEATVKAIGGVPGSYGEAVGSRARVGGLGIVVGASTLKRADWSAPYRYSPPDTNEVTAREVDIPDVREGAYLGLDYQDVRLMAAFTQWDHSYFFEGTVGQNRWRRMFGDLGYRFRVSEKLGWEMSLNATYTLAQMRSSTFPGVDRTSHDIIGEWTNYVQLQRMLRLVAGALFNQTTGKEEFVGDARRLAVLEEDRSSGAFYAQLDFRPVKALALIGGVQANVYENVDPSAVPRAGLILQPIDKINVKVLYGRAFRAPSLNEIALRHPELWGREDLGPETVDSLDAGVNYVGDRLLIGANYFYAKQRDIIMVDVVPSVIIDAPSRYENLGEVTLQGGEFEGKVYLSKDVFLTGSALYFQSVDGDDNENVTPVPNFGTKAGLSYMSTDNGVTASLFHIFQGPLDRKYDARLNPNPDPYHLLRLYGAFDFARAFDWRVAESLALFVEGQNLFDYEIFRPDWGGVLGETIPFRPGRTVYFGVSGTVPGDVGG
ncbi:MAG: TonB-dependent receptor [Polyangiaceae bacterium]|nr:TonB-dependent receptor [Polyangiaceae bacterium]